MLCRVNDNQGECDIEKGIDEGAFSYYDKITILPEVHLCYLLHVYVSIKFPFRGWGSMIFL